MASDDRPIALTIGTAGHVDHGKTTLVRYMTGKDTDRLEEEHRRGISIVPGYAELDLPSGRRASLVDVPGHERFVKNMVAGATGVDAFLLVVAADDGVMPQTREHLDVLRVLGVERGVVALTKIDAVDEETAELAELDAAELLESVGLPAPLVRVSGTTGEGVDDLLAALDELAGGSGDGRPGALARLPVDRAFVLKGIGLVATGTLWSGEIRVGDTLHTASGKRPRVRGVQNHDRPAEVAYAGARTALDLVGVEASQLEPGDVLLSSPLPPTRALDARVRLLDGAAYPLKNATRLRLYHGTRATNARVRLLDREGLAAGESALARLSLQDPLVVLPGDRFVLRSSSPQVTVGGGAVLDPAPAGRRLDPAWLEALEGGDWGRVVPLALAREPWRSRGMTAEELSLVVPVAPEGIPASVANKPEVFELGRFYALASETEGARGRLLDALEKRSQEQPESPELSVAEARTATGFEPRLADALLARMAGAEEPEISVTDSGVSLPDTGEVPRELEREAGALLDELRRAGDEPPAVGETAAARLLLKRGEAVRLGVGLLAAAGVADEVVAAVETACREEGEITLAHFRDRLGTTRKFAQAWLEYADDVGVTRRLGDVRVLTRRYR
ncbi:MAG: Selenocysteine-specific translation elongation factor [uncultured Thermomicrobiales bacterium]|uniref:Selenocysteine-specific elongation factor n=1 Tax=uncultured Thermomicrobiales bacterium TaxID=1645740 RepID=A0A6J4VX28_9BACT|nr:MAG: Selenocysteine-specific translation elongation factor [uncultured Thermomicrobiales bacterium]